MQQISCAAKPAQKRHNREAVQRRHLCCMVCSGAQPRSMMRSGVRTKVKSQMAEVQMTEAAEEREHAQHQPHTKTRQVDRIPIQVSEDHRFAPPRLLCDPFAALREPPFVTGISAALVASVATSNGAFRITGIV